jgi:hypothetical protein
MKSKNNFLSAIAALAIGVGSAEVMAATSPDAADFAAAQSQGTVDALQGFIAAHPTSPLAADAVTQIAQLNTPAEQPGFLDQVKSFLQGLGRLGQTGAVGDAGPGDRDSGHDGESRQHSIY